MLQRWTLDIGPSDGKSCALVYEKPDHRQKARNLHFSMEITFSNQSISTSNFPLSMNYRPCSLFQNSHDPQCCRLGYRQDSGRVDSRQVSRVLGSIFLPILSWIRATMMIVRSHSVFAILTCSCHPQHSSNTISVPR